MRAQLRHRPRLGTDRERPSQGTWPCAGFYQISQFASISGHRMKEASRRRLPLPDFSPRGRARVAIRPTFCTDSSVLHRRVSDYASFDTGVFFVPGLVSFYKVFQRTRLRVGDALV